MRSLALILAPAGVLLVATAVGIASWAGLGGGLLPIVGALLLDSDPLAKLAILVLAGSFLAIALMGVTDLVRKSARRSDGLFVLGITSPAIGLAAAAYGAMNIYIAMVRTNTTSFAVIAPSVSEVILIAGLGVFTGGVASAINAVLVRRAARA